MFFKKANGEDCQGSVHPISFLSLPDDFSVAQTVNTNTNTQQESSERNSHCNNAQINQQNKCKEGGLQKQAAVEQPPAVRFRDMSFAVKPSLRSAAVAALKSQPVDKTDKAAALQEADPMEIRILKNINLKVPQGCIYGLLGPSSCGKTTLLRCLVGLLKHTSGDVELFGKRVQTREERVAVKVPGIRIGYMPQEIGLYNDFTIFQMLSVFGGYYGMSRDVIDERIKFMAHFLDLPNVDRTIETLSGGQKRRVSFAVACIHKPKLIILDEPTVGVDPLLRQAIWKYLRRLASEEETSIIITTHYIEEAAQADLVALMREGQLLIEDSPQVIMSRYNCKSLEDAFLKICNNVDRSGDETREVQRPNTSNNDCKRNSYDNQTFDASDELDLPTASKTKQPAETRASDLRRRSAQIGDQLGAAKRQASDSEPSQKRPSKWTSNAAEALSNATTDKDVHFDNNQKSFIAKNAFTCADLKSGHKSSGEPDSLDSGKKLDWKVSLARKTRAIRSIIYKNYKRNLNSIPLVIFQFVLPMIQMISFSLCVGGKPSNIGLGIINADKPSLEFFESQLTATTAFVPGFSTAAAFNDSATTIDAFNTQSALLSNKFIDLIDTSMMSIKYYDNLNEALSDVRETKLWAALEFRPNFTESLISRFDIENSLSIERSVLDDSIIRLYPDAADKIVNMICERSLGASFRKFLSAEFEQFSRLPIEVKQVIFDISPNLISSSLDGYTESIATGLLASLTYIMAAGLTTFVMVLERRDGILERTYTTGLNPAVYLLTHAFCRSVVMSLQLSVILFLTFGIIQQPLVGSAALTYLLLMSLNCTGIAFGLVVSALCEDQNGAALAIVSSLCFKLTLSGILWPVEAVPKYLKMLSAIQPLTMPVLALKNITLKGHGLEDKYVRLGLMTSFVWMTVFLAIASRKFKFYQH